jgi:hypothetical protein
MADVHAPPEQLSFLINLKSKKNLVSDPNGYEVWAIQFRFYYLFANQKDK